MENVYLLPNIAKISHVNGWFKRNGVQIELTTVVIRGYRAYFVEQWVASREPGSLIVTYTGDEADELDTAQLCVVDTSKGVNWPHEFVTYLEFQQNHGTATQTDQGIIFITDLADMDANLFFVDCPTRDIRGNYHLYKVNYNLKMLGFSSRSATTVAIPSTTVEDKFKAVFCTPENVPIEYTATQLIAVTQLFLYYFNLCELENCDGLLCNDTLAAIDSWWGIVMRVSSLGFKQRGMVNSVPTSILTIVGFTILCKSTLELGGSQFNPPKDIIDVDKMQSSIAAFQKSSKLHPSGFFNVETLTALTKWAQTIKVNSSFSKDLSKMKKMVKSTVNDFTSSSSKTQHKLTLDDPQKCIGCQNVDQVRTMGSGLGKKFSFLLDGKGQSFDFIHYIGQLTEKRMRNNLDSLDSTKERGSFTLHQSQSVQHFDSFGDDYNNIGNLDREDAAVESDMDYDHVDGFDYDHDVDGTGTTETSPQTVPDTTNDIDSSVEGVDCSENCKKYHDVEYKQFCNRLNRRNSIPLVEAEKNIHSIEPLKSNSANNLQRHNSGRYYNDKMSMTSRAYVDDNDNMSYLSSNHMNKRQSWITYQSNNMYEDKINTRSLRRAASLPCLLETENYKEEFVGLLTSSANYVTPEVLAMKYLNLKVSYQLDVVQKVTLWKRDLKYLKEDILMKTNTKWLEQTMDGKDTDGFHSVLLHRNKSANTTLNDYHKVVAKKLELEKKFMNVAEGNNRLRYELQTLLRKTTDVESSVAQLRDLKMKALIEKVQKISDTFDHNLVLSTSACKEETEQVSSDSVIDRVCSTDGKVDWSQVQWDEVAMRPHVLSYIVFRWAAYVICHTFDSAFIEQQWRQIDKNNTVTKVFREMYDKGERLFKAKKE